MPVEAASSQSPNIAFVEKDLTFVQKVTTRLKMFAVSLLLCRPFVWIALKIFPTLNEDFKALKKEWDTNKRVVPLNTDDPSKEESRVDGAADGLIKPSKNESLNNNNDSIDPPITQQQQSQPEPTDKEITVDGVIKQIYDGIAVGEREESYHTFKKEAYAFLQAKGYGKDVRADAPARMIMLLKEEFAPQVNPAIKVVSLKPIKHESKIAKKEDKAPERKPEPVLAEFQSLMEEMTALPEYKKLNSNEKATLRQPAILHYLSDIKNGKFKTLFPAARDITLKAAMMSIVHRDEEEPPVSSQYIKLKDDNKSLADTKKELKAKLTRHKIPEELADKYIAQIEKSTSVQFRLRDDETVKNGEAKHNVQTKSKFSEAKLIVLKGYSQVIDILAEKCKQHHKNLVDVLPLFSNFHFLEERCKSYSFEEDIRVLFETSFGKKNGYIELFGKSIRFGGELMALDKEELNAGGVKTIINLSSREIQNPGFKYVTIPLAEFGETIPFKDIIDKIKNAEGNVFISSTRGDNLSGIIMLACIMVSELEDRSKTSSKSTVITRALDEKEVGVKKVKKEAVLARIVAEIGTVKEKTGRDYVPADYSFPYQLAEYIHNKYVPKEENK